MLFSSKSDHVVILLKTLQWFPITHNVKIKIPNIAWVGPTPSSDLISGYSYTIYPVSILCSAPSSGLAHIMVSLDFLECSPLALLLYLVNPIDSLTLSSVLISLRKIPLTPSRGWVEVPITHSDGSLCFYFTDTNVLMGECLSPIKLWTPWEALLCSPLDP